jgi:hypothetical protein
MPPSVTVVIDPYGEYRRPREAGIPFERTLCALLAQTYARELTTILLTCTAAEVPLVETLVQGEPRIRVTTVPAGSGYYQKKNHGALVADSDIVLMADGDCLYPTNWIAEMVEAFDRGGAVVTYVQGRSQFAPGPFAQVLNPLYWRNYEPEGPISQIYSAHNLAIRRADVPEFLFDDTPERAGLERSLARRIRRAGRVIWHNRATTVQHESSMTLRELRQQALGKGYYRMIVWRRHPNAIDRALAPLGQAAIPVYVLLLSVRDGARQLKDRAGRGLHGMALLKLVPYTVFTFAFHAVGAISMSRVLRHLERTGSFPAPEFYGSDGPPDLGRRVREVAASSAAEAEDAEDAVQSALARDGHQERTPVEV